MDLLKLANIIEEVVRLSDSSGLASGFCIGNTGKFSPEGGYYSPIRFTSKLISGSAIVSSVSEARLLAQYIDGRVDYVLVDVEKKINPINYGVDDLGNIEIEVKKIIKKSELIEFKGNDITVDSVMNLIASRMKNRHLSISGKRGAIIGCGNIGSKLALRLNEAGMNVIVTRTNKEKLDTIVSALNYIKPAETLATIIGITNNLAATNQADLLVSTVNSPVITKLMIQAMHPNPILVDLGKGGFENSAINYCLENAIPIYRADIISGFEGAICSTLLARKIYSKPLYRSTVNGVRVVSSGLLAINNEIVLDDIEKPTKIIGISDGCGNLYSSHSQEQIEMINCIETHYGLKA